MATLKISELSVGDWVRYSGRDYQVKSIHGDFERVTLIGNKEQRDESIYAIQPIPITADILEKNGWRIIEKEVLGEDYEYNGGERVWNDENYTIDISEAKRGVFWYSWSNEYYMWRLNYVHQLQHLIRVAGVDKEINL